MTEHDLTFQGPQMVLARSGVRKEERCSEEAWVNLTFSFLGLKMLIWGMHWKRYLLLGS